MWLVAEEEVGEKDNERKVLNFIVLFSNIFHTHKVALVLCMRFSIKQGHCNTLDK